MTSSWVTTSLFSSSFYEKHPGWMIFFPIIHSLSPICLKYTCLNINNQNTSLFLSIEKSGLIILTSSGQCFFFLFNFFSHIPTIQKGGGHVITYEWIMIQYSVYVKPFCYVITDHRSPHPNYPCSYPNMLCDLSHISHKIGKGNTNEFLS